MHAKQGIICMKVDMKINMAMDGRPFHKFNARRHCMWCFSLSFSILALFAALSFDLRLVFYTLPYDYEQKREEVKASLTTTMDCEL